MSYAVGESGYLIDDGTFITCPFNSTHKIIGERFPYHFVKCQTNYPGVEISHCPFNAKHCVRAEFIAKHIETCPDHTGVGQVVMSSPNTKYDSFGKTMVDGEFVDKNSDDTHAQSNSGEARTESSSQARSNSEETRTESFMARALRGELLKPNY